MKIEMDKEQVLADLTVLKGMFQHVIKYYPLSDKEVERDNFNEIVEDLKEYLTNKLE
jgi:hypothetical protein